MERWLLLDSNFLTHRALHSMGQLSHNDIKIGTIYGFLRDVVGFQELFDTTNVAFCWDYGLGIRKEMYPPYKAKRDARKAALTGTELAMHQEFHAQVDKLRDRYLPKLGYSNVFFKEGYESDDIIASLCATLQGKEIIIITADKDLWQCLGPDVRQYNPTTKQTTTAELFRQTWGIEPDQWADVLSIAGCNTDEVAGLAGIGKLTAAKYLRDELKPGTKLAAIDCRNGSKVWRRNLGLTRLPLAGVGTFTLQPDTVSVAKWQALCDKLGFQSIRGDAPLAGRALQTRRKGFGIGG